MGNSTATTQHATQVLQPIEKLLLAAACRTDTPNKNSHFIANKYSLFTSTKTGVLGTLILAINMQRGESNADFTQILDDIINYSTLMLDETDFNQQLKLLSQLPDKYPNTNPISAEFLINYIRDKELHNNDLPKLEKQQQDRLQCCKEALSLVTIQLTENMNEENMQKAIEANTVPSL